MKRPSNKFVINIEGSHGHTDYQLIGTISEFKKMVDTVQAQLERMEARSATDVQFEPGGHVLFNEYVTLAPGQIDRNSITFKIGSDMISYERRSFWQSHIREYLILAVIAAILILAGIGVISVFRFFMR